MSGNYYRKLSASTYISSSEKCGNYRDTGVSNNTDPNLRFKLNWWS